MSSGEVTDDMLRWVARLKMLSFKIKHRDDRDWTQLLVDLESAQELLLDALREAREEGFYHGFEQCRQQAVTLVRICQPSELVTMIRALAAEKEPTDASNQS